MTEGRNCNGDRVSPAFVESAARAVFGKRFSRRQQMRRPKPGARLVLQAGTRALNGLPITERLADAHRAR